MEKDDVITGKFALKQNNDGNINIKLSYEFKDFIGS